MSVCDQAEGQLRDGCYTGASQDRVLLDGDVRSADPLCDALDDHDPEMALVCRDARDAIGATL